MKVFRPSKSLLALLTALVSTTALPADEGSTVERCTKRFGTLVVAESQTGWNHLSHYGLGSPAARLRMMDQKSGCFDVVERGVGIQNL